jgi:PAS domain-containing protein
MPEPTSEGLELRVRRLYPHASVAANDGIWLVRRDRSDAPDGVVRWWLDPDVARARYDAQALILEANPAATKLFGRELVGHHWQEFVTAGSTEEVGLMLQILSEIGAAESRFRLPMPDGSLLEFDSYTEGSGEEFTSAYRVVPDSPDTAT